MPLSDLQKATVRRHAGYPAQGLLRVSPAGGTVADIASGYRFFGAYGFLEYKLNNLQPGEEAILLGLATGSVMLVGPQPNGGDTLSLTFSAGPLGSPVTVTVTAAAPLAGTDNRVTLINAMAAAIVLNATLQSAGFLATAPYGTGPVSDVAVAVAGLGVTCAQAFTLACGGTGLIAPALTSTGAFAPPSAVLVSGGAAVYGYVPIINALEGAWAGASGNLDTDQAAVWKRNVNEERDRERLRNKWRREMCGFLGVRPGENLPPSGVTIRV